MMFTEYAKGIYSVYDIQKIVTKHGLRTKKGEEIHVNSIYTLMHNPFYCGMIRYKKYKIIAPHPYPTLITKELFDTCQEIMRGRRSVAAKPKNKEVDFAFRGLIRCHYCGAVYSPELKKEKYVYMRPNKRNNKCKHCKPVPEKSVIKQMEDCLKNIKIPENILHGIKNALETTLNSKKQFHNTNMKTLKTNYTTIQRKIDNLLDLRLEDGISKEVYDKKFSELKAQQYEINKQLQNYTEADEHFNITFSLMLELTQKAHQLFKSSNSSQKKQLLNFLCSNFTLEGEKLRPDWAFPFSEFFKNTDYTVWLPGRDSNPRPID